MSISISTHTGLLLSFGLALASASQPSSAIFLRSNQIPITEAQAVALALKGNPRVRASLLRIEAGKWGVRSARALANPSVLLTPGLTRPGSDEELLISLPLEINGTRAARTGIAQARLQGAQAEAILEIRDLVYETRLAFQEAVRAQDRSALAKDLLKTAEELDRFALRQVELGSRPGIERTQTSIEVRRARQASALSEAEALGAFARLRAITMQPPETPVLLASIGFAPSSFDEVKGMQMALDRRPELASARAIRDAARQEARLARAEGLPDLAPQFRAESLTREPRASGFGVAFTLPIFDLGERRGRIRQSEAEARSEEARIAGMQLQIRQEVQQALVQLRASEAVVQEFRSGLLDDARRLFESSRTGFQLGQTTITSLLEAQRTYRSVQTEYIDALVSHARALAEFERATGALPEGVPVGIVQTQEQIR